MPTEGRELTTPQTLRTHTLVIGSGAGGAVAAHRLAQARVDTIMLEEGGHHQGHEFNQREEDMYPMLYRAGGQQLTEDGLVSVMQGSVLGGGTVINTADCTKIEPEVLAHWRRAHGLTQLTEAAFEPSYRTLWQELNIHRLEAAIINRNNGLLLDTANRLGYRAGVFESNRRNCVGSSYCLLGCSYNAKQGAHVTYIPWAEEAGARIYTDVRADRIERRDGGGYRVHASVVERGPRTPRLAMTIECERLILAAGAINSSALLKRSGFDSGLPELGKHVSLQPQLGVFGMMTGPDKPVGWRGAPQSVYVSHFDDNHPDWGLGGFRFEGIGGVLGSVLFGLPGYGEELKRRVARLPDMQVSLLLVPDRPVGSFDWSWDDNGKVHPKITYPFSDEWVARLKRGMKAFAAFLFEAGAEEVGFQHQAFAPLQNADEIDRVDDFAIEPGLMNFFSAHVQGGCRIGLNKDRGVVDQNLKVHGLDNLYVVDGAVMPSTASTHTMIPIMAMADRAMQRMLA